MQQVGAYLIVQTANSAFRAVCLTEDWSAEAAHESELADKIAEHARARPRP